MSLLQSVARQQPEAGFGACSMERAARLPMAIKPEAAMQRELSSGVASIRGIFAAVQSTRSSIAAANPIEKRANAHRPAACTHRAGQLVDLASQVG